MKKYLFSIILFFIATFCILSPQDMITATKSGLTLWYNVILPALFPFLILSELIAKSALPYIFEKIFSPIMKNFFDLPGISAIGVFLGMLGGYPIGAKTTGDLLQNKTITQSTANHMITFVNNSGPLFILGAIGIGLYKNATIGILLLISHYSAALLTGFIFRFFKDKSEIEKTHALSTHIEIIQLSKLSAILTESIKRAISLTCIIGGFIIIFSILSTILEKTGILLFLSKLLFPKFNHQTIYAIFAGILEVSNGVNKIALLSIPLFQKLIITSMLVSFAGFSIHMQTLSVLNNTGISFSKYFFGKIIQSIFSGIATYILLWKTNFSMLLTTSVIANRPTYTETEINVFLSVILGLLLFSSLFKLCQIAIASKKDIFK